MVVLDCDLQNSNSRNCNKCLNNSKCRNCFKYLFLALFQSLIENGSLMKTLKIYNITWTKIEFLHIKTYTTISIKFFFLIFRLNQNYEKYVF